jgi:hypothetical protein
MGACRSAIECRGIRSGKRARGYDADAAGFDSFMPYFLRKRSMRPAVSTSFCYDAGIEIAGMQVLLHR